MAHLQMGYNNRQLGNPAAGFILLKGHSALRDFAVLNGNAAEGNMHEENIHEKNAHEE